MFLKLDSAHISFDCHIFDCCLITDASAMDMLGFVSGQLMMMEIGLSSVYVSTKEQDRIVL